MFKRNGRNRNLVGLDIGSSSVKVVELQGKPGALTLTSLAHEGLQPDTVVDGQIMEINAVSHTIAHVFAANQIKTAGVAAGVSGSSVIVKNIIVPPMTEDELQESIEWHAEEHIPFDIADVALDYQITGKTPDSLHVLMAACKREFVANVRQAIQLAGKQPCVIDVDAFALQNCYEVN
jgi:type IV pilus assembly protein PilM